MKRIIAILVSSMFYMSVSNAGVSVDPVQMYIQNPTKQRTTTLTLESKDETEKRIFEVKAFKWTQKDNGENVLEPDNSLIINPKNFILQANGKQTIRIGFNRPVESVLEGQQEGTWRVIVDEIPQAVKESSVNFLVSFNLPLFVGKQEDVKLNFNVENNKLIVKNNAKSHIQIANLKIVDANKKEVFKTETMNYLLANKSASYDLNNIRISNPKNYYVQLFTDKNDKMVELKFSD
ncbi:fimbria/pilus periplasmic chaperone [Acinetobacter johnsonii]|uniref:Fimbria/pilus periplasmic chaperone n=1 Tax=Acinetobacter johnsonii TaxID=40214 RepID=A0AA42MW33_ACIJO|nr:fimbria/pilus periplasmic chaperone [Acinetobacter johnsonii]MDH0970259.1 fimbria/pilus periplasmic chaperone [Acinetobacter johnsonii]WQN47017.1 fimbria/pilus periplasmic chaperone [Acinetobacter johnsonii]